MPSWPVSEMSFNILLSLSVVSPGRLQYLSLSSPRLTQLSSEQPLWRPALSRSLWRRELGLHGIWRQRPTRRLSSPFSEIPGGIWEDDSSDHQTERRHSSQKQPVFIGQAIFQGITSEKFNQETQIFWKVWYFFELDTSFLICALKIHESFKKLG